MSPAISNTSRAICACRIRSPSHHVEAFGVDALAGNADLPQCVFRGVHHRVRAADEELESTVPARKVAGQDVGAQVAGLARPLLRRALEDVHDGEVELVLEPLELI